MGMLDHLVTDFWWPPGRIASKFPLSLRGRWHSELKNAKVKAFTRQCLVFEARARAARREGWGMMMARNQWFQDQATRWLERRVASGIKAPDVVASYSYAASRIFFTAKPLGCKTVMFQIDPGPAEERILLDVERKYPDLIKQRVVAPARYWADWKLQCELADAIIVNSEWSRSCLIDAEVASEKIRIIPLAYQKEAGPPAAERVYPAKFTDERPLRVLFLGQVNLRKGMGEILEVARLLKNAPVEFWIAGPETIRVPDEDRANPRVKWLGTIPRLRIDEFYREADVFLFPTISDGFGLTQLEAQARGLPVIASRFCGSVVRDGENGLLLREVSAGEIRRALDHCVNRPQDLQRMARNSGVRTTFGFQAIKAQIEDVLTSVLQK
jgi:glycosyltransferase involved in cell wall biosynthesis